MTSKRFISSFIPLEKIVFNPAQPQVLEERIEEKQREAAKALAIASAVAAAAAATGTKFPKDSLITSGELMMFPPVPGQEPPPPYRSKSRS